MSPKSTHFGISVAELDSDVADELVLEPDGMHAGDGFDDSGLAMGDMPNGT